MDPAPYAPRLRAELCKNEFHNNSHRESHIDPAQRKHPARTPAQGNMGPPAAMNIPIDPSLSSWPNQHPSALFSQGPAPPQPPRTESRYLGRSSLSDSSGGFDAIPPHVLEPRSGDFEPDPLVRFWRDDGPWNPQGVGSCGLAHFPTLQHTTSNERGERPQLPYRESGELTSEPRRPSRNPSDSGYGSQSQFPQSLVSANLPDHSQDSHSIPGDTERFQLRAGSTSRGYPYGASEETHSIYDNCSNDSRDPGSGAGPGVSIPCDLPQCGTVSKNPSENRKHRQRHEKPFVCQVTDCTRNQKGFSTKNDLERHRKSVHKITPLNSADRSFKCKGLNCTKREKIWPRLDNFRSHGKRVHKDEDLDDLVRRSEIDLSTIPNLDVRYGQMFDADIIRTHRELVGLAEVRGMNQPVFEGPASQHNGHEPQSISTELLQSGMDNPGSTQLPAIESFDRTCVMLDTRLYPGEVRFSREQRSPMLAHNGSLSRSTVHSPSVASNGNATSMPRSTQQHSQVSIGVIDNEAQTNIPYLRSSPRILQAAIEKADQVSKEITSDLTKSIRGNASPEEMQLIIRTKVLSLLSPSSSSIKRSSEDAGLDNLPEANGKRVACSICSKQMGRPCDVKKHEKRHRRPYGCTHATCSKAFGSKNDWKRHENSQHYQLETWRCHEHNSQSKIRQCAKIFYRRDPFQIHLRKDHNVKDEEYIREECKRRRIGRNGQSGFWCGFCKQIVKLEKRGLEAWDERFNHIDDMHFKNGQSSDDWYPLDKDIPKGLLKSENILDSGGLATSLEDSEAEDSDGREGRGWNQDASHRQAAPVLSQGRLPSSVSLQVQPLQNMSNGVGMERTQSNKKQKTMPRTWYCCQCRAGPHNPVIVALCWGSCNGHRLCSSCLTEENEGR